MALTRLGYVRAFWLATVVCMGGFLFGYDSGIVGGVLTLKSFEHDFGYTSKESTHNTSLAVSLQQLGAFVSCFAIWPITDSIGRRFSLMICSAVFIIGVVIEVIKTHSLAAFYVGRVIAGLGLGATSVVVPMFNSEMAPKELRGTLLSFYQWGFTFGIFTSYWIDYGVAKDLKRSSAQWQIPIGLQIVPAALLGLGMFTVKESTRWLTKKGRHDIAWDSLVWVRASDGPEVASEMEEIRIAVELEYEAKEGFQFKELLLPENFAPIFTAFLVFTAQQATGATAFAYYAPQYFTLLVGGSNTSNLLLTGIFGAVKVLACAAFVLLFADRWNRRSVLIYGALFMAACQISTAAVYKELPGRKGEVTSSGIATIALIYLFVIAYNFSWGPLPWAYVAEIFPARIREPGIATGVGAQWLWNFVFTLTTPYMKQNLGQGGWGTFLLWGLLDFVIALYAFFGLKETRGKSLEENARAQKLGLNRRVQKAADDEEDSSGHSPGASASGSLARRNSIAKNPQKFSESAN